MLCHPACHLAMYLHISVRLGISLHLSHSFVLEPFDLRIVNHEERQLCNQVMSSKILNQSHLIQEQDLQSLVRLLWNLNCFL